MFERVINDTEWDILEALWRLERATAREVAEALEPTRGWSYSTVKTMLDRMKGKALVEARRVGNVWEYSSAVEPVQARRSAWQRFVAAAFDGATDSALRFIARDVKLTGKQREELRRLLDNDADGDRA